MLSGIIAYQVLQQENPATIEKVKAVLEKHPWYANQSRAASSCANFIFFRIQPLKDFTLALVIIGNENDVQKRENSTNHAANKH
jgi:hypothetical protein